MLYKNLKCFIYVRGEKICIKIKRIHIVNSMFNWSNTFDYSCLCMFKCMYIYAM